MFVYSPKGATSSPRVSRVLAAFACVAALALCGWLAPLAWAANEQPSTPPDVPSNEVNTQQLPDSSFIYDASISDLESADSYLDKQTVQITGEVVGDRIRAEGDPDYCWILMQAIDGSHASVSVYMSNVSADLIDTYGAYGKKGTVLQVRGVFHLSCGEHEGLSDLHAQTVTHVSNGVVTPDEFDFSRMVPGIVLVLIGLVLMIVFHRMRESRR